jgi:hypothetical protein
MLRGDTNAPHLTPFNAKSGFARLRAELTIQSVVKALALSC